jgi:hypothetical protein
VDATVLRTAYQGAGGSSDYHQVDAQLAAFTREAGDLGALRADVDDANPLARLGGAVVGSRDALARAQAAVERGEAAAADRAVASARDTTGKATGVGAALLAGVLVLLAGLALGMRRLRSRRARAAGLEAVDGTSASVVPDGSVVPEGSGVSE